MSQPLHIQLAVAASPAAIFHALTDSTTLAQWFAAHADVSLPQQRYDFWGRFTPDAPEHDQGCHPLLKCAPQQRLCYGWLVGGADTQVEIILRPRHEQTLLVMQQHNAPNHHGVASYTLEDFWLLSLENLRRHLDGKRPVWCDFSARMVGDITHTIEVTGSAEAIFEKLIRPDQLERWIASHATVEPVVGGRYAYGWQESGAVKILELRPNEKLSVLWPEETETVVTWTLEESDGKTRITLVHSGFAPHKPTGGYNAGWLNFLSWIKSMVEYGPTWQAPVIALQADAVSLYAKTIGERQYEIIHA